MSTPLTATDAIKLLDTALKNNNDWFYDKPDTTPSTDETYKFAGKYFTLAAKWTQLNKASIEALKVIIDQKDEITKLENRINTQDKLINRLNTEVVTLTNACKENE